MNDSRRYHHGNLRAALLERAEHVLATGGVESLNLRQLARDLGVSHAAPRRHFADKADLLDALALVALERLAEAFEAVTVGGSEDLVSATARAYVDFAVANDQLLTLMFTRKHADVEGMEAAVTRAFQVPIELMVRDQQAGRLVQGDPTSIGTYFIAVLHGLAALVNSGFVAPESVDATLAGAIERMRFGLLPR